MPYQYKREPLNNDEVDKLTNACSTFREKFVVWTLLDTGLRLSEFANLKKSKNFLIIILHNNESKHLFLEYYAISYFSTTIYRPSFYLLFLKIAIPTIIIYMVRIREGSILIDK
ncbi:MAG: hypothetical protein WBF68_05565 [Atribacterota bacterium]